MRTTKRDYGMSQICPLAIDTLPYDGLCSHCCLSEGVSGDFDLTPEELDAKAAEIKQRHADKSAVRSKDWVQHQLATNADAYRAGKAATITPQQESRETCGRDCEDQG
jgi:hypothetical protein